MAIESSWNYETTLSANLLGQLMKLTNKSLQTMLSVASSSSTDVATGSSGNSMKDCELVIAFMKRLAAQWEDSLLVPPSNNATNSANGSVSTADFDSMSLSASVSSNAQQAIAWKEHRNIVEEVVKFYCLCHDVDKARELLVVTLEATDPVFYEPLIFCLACVQGAMDEAKILLNHMLSLDMTPTRKIIDSIVKGYLIAEKPVEALDAAIELFQQHRVMPSSYIFDMLTQASRKVNDEHEIARISYSKSVIFKTS
jgi:hypothetical protein